jgi:hypothetical protein
MQKVHVFIKVQIRKLASFDKLLRETALEIHHQFKHLIIGLAWKENLARVELKQRAAD